MVTGSGLDQVTRFMFGTRPGEIGTKTFKTLIVESPPGNGMVPLSAESRDPITGKRYSSAIDLSKHVFEYSKYENCKKPFFSFQN